MKISGIICEYNPFHNGHLYHMMKTRENGATHIVCVMSGNFVQRGELAYIDKFARAKAAGQMGADLVVEIPTVYCLSSAEYYAKGAVSILNSLGCVEELSFGSECGEISRLYEAARVSKEFSNSPQLRALLENGDNFPTAQQKLIFEKYGQHMASLFDGANNLLGIEYIKALNSLGSNIKPFTVARTSVRHDSSIPYGNYASASCIRQCICDGISVRDLVPEKSNEIIRSYIANGYISDTKNLERFILGKLRCAEAWEIENVPDVAHGLEHRIADAASNAESLEQLYSEIKTKRYTMARIRRIILNFILGIGKPDLQIFPPYGRILYINDSGTEILSKAKGTMKIPFGTSLAKLSALNPQAKRFTEIEARAMDIYTLASRTIRPAGMEYTTKIGIS